MPRSCYKEDLEIGCMPDVFCELLVRRNFYMETWGYGKTGCRLCCYGSWEIRV